MSKKGKGNPSKYRGYLAPHEYDAITSMMPRARHSSHREAARQVLVNGMPTTEAAKAYGISTALVSANIQSILRVRQRFLRAMALFNNGNSSNKGETK